MEGARREAILPARPGKRIEARKGQTIIAVDGGQAADLFAEAAGSPGERFSPGAIIDCDAGRRSPIGVIVE